jgi:hypothetical protein
MTELRTPYQTEKPDPNAFTTYQVSVTHREYQALKRLRHLAANGKQLALVEFTERGPCVREVGKREE